MVPEIGVVVRTYNEEVGLPKLITSLNKQEHTDWNLVVVDSGSTDKTIEIAKDQGAKVIFHEPYIPGVAWNKGLEQVQSPYAALLTAHVELESTNWLSRMKEVCSDPRIAGVYSRQRAADTASWHEKWFRWSMNSRVPITALFGVVEGTLFTPQHFLLQALVLTVINRRLPRIRNSNIGWGFNAGAALIKTDVWKKYPFPKDAIDCDDLVWAINVVHKGGYQVKYVDNVSAYHPDTTTLTEFWKKRKQLLTEGLLLNIFETCGLGGFYFEYSEYKDACMKIPALADLVDVFNPQPVADTLKD